MMLPALRALALDRATHGMPASVYLRLAAEFLDVEEYRPLKIGGVAAAMRVAPATVSRAIRALVAQGYLEERPASPGRREFRLLWTRRGELDAGQLRR